MLFEVPFIFRYHSSSIGRHGQDFDNGSALLPSLPFTIRLRRAISLAVRLDSQSAKPYFRGGFGTQLLRVLRR